MTLFLWHSPLVEGSNKLSGLLPMLYGCKSHVYHVTFPISGGHFMQLVFNKNFK